ncbi:polyprenyl synthetase family protein [Rhodovarius sp.]|uniref:polyprenyl synthetase family protein n=1 Tax=Rhodovarius sp. TaxID=2972673 RepID=UPI003340603E
MNAIQRIEKTLADALGETEGSLTPPLLARAMNHAVFPGGARVRPRLCLATAAACGQGGSELAAAAAAAIELLHCASLVHDDMPCFDNAATRRGRPAVHKAFGEPVALLAGDALIVLAFDLIGRAAARPGQGQKAGAVLRIVAQSVGAPFGIVAGQAWECEPQVDVAMYHRSKTGALFAGAAAAGAAAAGADPERWRPLGAKLGEAYQVADDIGDAVADDEAEMGKPIRQDTALGRPNAVRELGVEGALKRLRSLAEEAIAAIPACPGADALEAIIRGESKRLVPRSLAVYAA